MTQKNEQKRWSDEIKNTLKEINHKTKDLEDKDLSNLSALYKIISDMYLKDKNFKAAIVYRLYLINNFITQNVTYYKRSL